MSRRFIVHDCFLFICRYLRAAALHLATEYEDVQEQQTFTPKALELFDGWRRGES